MEITLSIVVGGKELHVVIEWLKIYVLNVGIKDF